MGRIVGLVFKDTKIKEKEFKNNDVDLNKLTLDQLKSLAEEKGIEFDHKIKKYDLIFLIENEIENEEEA
ncbi:Rho termination factor N-terminal domain-containing protein [Clostridium saudiense]|uniref:Rho termination factor N-terminal domain-containing protein n=1 Tax=Clostridium saudiense TaxID=1414720 RepID=UPI0018A967B3|nr:Rho termination factor N-terminal domain-containing protein [Clostridium saudiense]